MSTPSSNKRAPAISATARLRLKIQLDGSRPAIWRRVEVDDNLTFLDLHRVIQEAMGWENCHLHEFNVAGQRLSTASADDDEFGESEPALPEGSTTLGALLQGQRKFRYWYDFGDDWWHTLTVEKSLSRAPVRRRIAAASMAMPRCWISCHTPTTRVTRRPGSGWAKISTPASSTSPRMPGASPRWRKGEPGAG